LVSTAVSLSHLRVGVEVWILAHLLVDPEVNSRHHVVIASGYGNERRFEPTCRRQALVPRAVLLETTERGGVMMG
jgi:hypothetical protein